MTRTGYWDDEDQTSFYSGAQEIERRFGLSPGAAQAKLRELCASGAVRSVKQPYSCSRNAYEPMGPWELVQPSAWKTGEVDLATPDANGYDIAVDVSKADLDYQIGKTGTQRIEVNAPVAAPPPRQQKTPKRSRPLPRDRVREAARTLWPAGTPRPEEMTTPELLHQLGPVLKRHNIRVHDDTIKRALGRR